MVAVTATADGAHWAAYSSARPVPEVSWAPAREPAEVPTIRSAAVRSSPCAASPATRPTSQAAPVIPPAPSTSALVATAALLPPHASRDGNLPGVTVEVVHQVTDELVEAFARLVPQLSATTGPPGRKALEEIVGSSAITLLVARAEDTIVGTLTLAMFPIPTGFRAWIEDVVVDEAARGKGVGEALTNEAISLARAAGARTVDLTSRPSRKAAGRLYERAGFEERETRVYRYRMPA